MEDHAARHRFGFIARKRTGGAAYLQMLMVDRPSRHCVCCPTNVIALAFGHSSALTWIATDAVICSDLAQRRRPVADAPSGAGRLAFVYLLKTSRTASSLLLGLDFGTRRVEETHRTLTRMRPTV